MATPPILRQVAQPDAPAPMRTAADAATSMTSAAADIAAENWDLLFRAVLELLARVAAEKPAPAGTGVRLQAPGTALGECLAALDQLRTSVPPAQHRPMPSAAHEG